MRRGLILRNAPPEWNVRVHTLEDFYVFCAQQQIILHEDKPLESTGLYLIYEGRSHIFIDSRLRGADKLFCCWHEAGHYLLHPLGIQFFLGWQQSVEIEADIIAACALVPRSLLTHFWPGEIAELYGYPASLIELRQEIFDRWRI